MPGTELFLTFLSGVQTACVLDSEKENEEISLGFFCSTAVVCFRNIKYCYMRLFQTVHKIIKLYFTEILNHVLHRVAQKSVNRKKRKEKR
jgi:hypothetical protein